jgi:hypothetical protein
MNTAHWHIGNNTPGFLPDPDSTWVAHTPQDALIGLIGDLNSLVEYLDGLDSEAEDAVATLEEALPHFTDDGEVDLSNVDDSDVERILNSLADQLLINANQTAWWTRRCELDCADA